MAHLEKLISLIRAKPGQTTVELAAATSLPSSAVLGLLRHEPAVEMRGRRWHPAGLLQEILPEQTTPATANSDHPASLKAARVVLAEVGGLLCGALGQSLPEMPPTLPEIEGWIRDLQRQPVRQLAHALGEIADPMREGELARLLTKVKRLASAARALQERLGDTIANAREILDLLSEERAS